MKTVVLGKWIGSGAASDVYEYGPDKVCKLYKPNVGNVDYEYNKMQEAYETGVGVSETISALGKQAHSKRIFSRTILKL